MSDYLQLNNDQIEEIVKIVRGKLSMQNRVTLQARDSQFVTNRLITSPLVGERNILMSMSVCVFMCPRAYLQNYTSDLHQILCV